MLWFILESAVIIVLAFLLGTLVSWLAWRGRTVDFSRSEAVAAAAARHEGTVTAQRAELDRRAEELTRKNRQIASLSELVSTDTMELTERHRVELAARDSEITRLKAQIEVQRATIRRLSGTQPTAPTAPTAPAASAASAETAALPARQTAPGSEHPAPADPTANGTPVPAARTRADDAAEAPTDDAAEAPIDGAAAEERAAEEGGDELERIDGIGPRIGDALRRAGIGSFRQLADADVTTLQSALEGSGLRFAPSLPTWGRQARLLADGDEDGFSALTASLARRDTTGIK